MEKLITIKRAMNLSELGVTMSYLENNGITCYLRDEHFGVMPPAAATSGVQLQVIENEAEHAIELLIEGGLATKEEYEEHPYSDILTRFVEKIIVKLGGKG